MPGLDLMALLAIRRLGGHAAFGLAIRAELETHTGRGIRRSDAYVALDRLVEKGLVTSILGSPAVGRGGHARRYFHVTPAGSEILETCTRALASLSAREESSG